MCAIRFFETINETANVPIKKIYRSLAHSAGSAKQRDVRPTISEIEISETDKFGTTGTPFLNMVPPIDGARGSQKTFCPKTQGK